MFLLFDSWSTFKEYRPQRCIFIQFIFNQLELRVGFLTDIDIPLGLTLNVKIDVIKHLFGAQIQIFIHRSLEHELGCLAD